MQSLTITTSIPRNTCFFSADTAQEALEIHPREALELNSGSKFYQDDALLMVSAGVHVDESTLPRRKHYHSKERGDARFGILPNKVVGGAIWLLGIVRTVSKSASVP